MDRLMSSTHPRRGPSAGAVVGSIAATLAFCAVAGWLTLTSSRLDAATPSAPSASAAPSVPAERAAIAGPFAGGGQCIDPRLSQPDGVGDQFFATTASIPPRLVRGHRVRLSGMIHTDLAAGGRAGLWARAHDGQGRTLVFDNMADRAVAGRRAWSRHAIELDVPRSAEMFFFGVVCRGDGEAWFDELAIEVDGVPVDVATFVDLGFESPTLRGFALPGMNRFDARLVDAVDGARGTCLAVRRGVRPQAASANAPVPDRASWK